MGKKRKDEIASCFQCAGQYFCYSTKSPVISRELARSEAKNCTSLHKGTPKETITVLGFDRGLSRGNAERLVANNYARWVGYKTIEPGTGLPAGIENRLSKGKKQHKKENLVIG
ncbi:MAG: hypothetical protein AVO34_12900 [Firmicutes bacterium ML8_F2]|jgi:hypothetical protein|nr:MAG: hypothetical protein AVO34_12900 [Firmicutes bacterium ML8_F2]